MFLKTMHYFSGFADRFPLCAIRHADVKDMLSPLTRIICAVGQMWFLLPLVGLLLRRSLHHQQIHALLIIYDA